jgi:hypothetical protein
MPYETILDYLTLSEHSNVYLVGVHAKRVTIYSQQVRALNLIDAIHFYRTPLTGRHVAIVGAGVAGLTAAARALQYGAHVTVLDRRPTELLQTNSRHRWLHPTIYDWPIGDWNEIDASAGLPVLTWSAAEADSFAREFKKRWIDIKKSVSDRIVQIANAAVNSIEPDGGLIRVHWTEQVANAPPKDDSGTFPTVLLAVGFGLEGNQNSYWEQDPLDQNVHDNRVILVAGYGDGALTDLMRACLNDFDHKQLLTDVINAVNRSGQLDLIKGIELDENLEKDAFVTKHYKALHIQPVQDILQAQRNLARRVILTGPGEHLFSARASALNRLVVSQLLDVGAFEHYPLADGAKIGLALPDPQIQKIESDARAKITNTILRFGPVPSIDEIVGLGKGVQTLKSKWNILQPRDDITRQRLWERFNPISPELDKACLLFDDPKGSSAPLPLTVENALGNVKNALGNLPGVALELKSVGITDCLRSHEALIHTVRALSLAPVCIFSLGARMGEKNIGGLFLLGIRAALRRGVTIVGHTEKLDPPDWNALPFNLKELQVLDLSRGIESARVLADAISGGVLALQTDAMTYRDLPVFDVVRQPYRRTPLTTADETEVFVLCPFGKRYTDNNWEYLKLMLQGVEKLGGKLALRRVFDYSSPLLVGERLYELIRFCGLCLVDWTEWRPNVFFEMGVRFVVNPVKPICILAKDEDLEADPSRRQFADLFAPLRYPIGGAVGDLTSAFQSAFADEIANRGAIPPPKNALYVAAQTSIRLDQEFGSAGVDTSLVRQVNNVVGRDQVAAGGFPVLFGANRMFQEQIWRGAIETLYAAHLLLQQKLDLGITRSDPERIQMERSKNEVRSRLLDLLEMRLTTEFDRLAEILDVN